MTRLLATAFQRAGDAKRSFSYQTVEKPVQVPPLEELKE
jgi:hypothetical protein